jgi:competence protein ComEA
MSIRERLDQLSRGELAGLAIVVVATLLGAGLWYMRSLPRPVDIAAPADAASPAVSPISGATGSLAPSAASIIVDVAGWVRRPGVYEFASGDRVIDAIDRAGGPRKDADLTTLNLAAPLMDGTQIVVPKPGSTTSGDPGSTGTATSGGTTLININSAGETELEGLPGVGPVTAAAIIDYRMQNGPFATVDDLIDVTGIGPSTLEQIRPFATV